MLNICSTASQEIGHAWTLDHVVDGTDPMSYNLQYNPVQPSFRDHQTCGSDCIGGQSPLQLSCSSNNNMTATHTCFSTDASTQDELSTILQLFGPSNAMPPTVAITSPSNHATVSAGFTVKATCSAASGDAVAQVQLLVDGAAGPVLTAAPFTFTAPSGLANGAHQVDVTCSTASQQQATATVNVTLGVGCSAAMTCPGANDVCLNGACIPGSGAAGGLGATCTKNADCDSMECATSSAGSFCVVPCDPNMPDVCPSSFGCDMAGATSVCFPNGDSGGGGCNSSSSGGTIVLGLGFAVLLVTRRRP